MKGIILAGGTGSRLKPMTDICNKHTLPLAGKPMIYHAIGKFAEADIKEIMIITGTEHAGNMFQSLGSGKKFNCNFTYKIQDEPNGIAGALLLAKEFVGNDLCCVILADNIFTESINSFVQVFESYNNSAMFILKEVIDPQRFGVAVIEDKKIVSIVEKPSKFISNKVITGIYFYKPEIFDVIVNVCKPSERGELEISDANDFLIKNGNALSYCTLDGFWSDCGTVTSYIKTNKELTKNL